jgi:tetratricopeptide (TPR) repeat protein
MLKLLFLLATFQALAAPIDIPIKSNGSNPYATEDLLARRGEFVPPPNLLDVADVEKVLFSDIKTQDTGLKKVKYLLINGETRLARVYLSQLSATNTKLAPLFFRYLGVMAFIEGDFHNSLLWLSKPELQSMPHYSKICILKTLNQIVLNKTQYLEQEWDRCVQENPKNFNPDNIVWMQILVNLKLTPHPGVTKVPFKRFKLPAMELQELKVFLKLALYLNQEEMIVDHIPSLDEEQLKDPEVREIAGQILFRAGLLAKSYKFVEDLKSPNSENIKGNLYILRKKYEIAYAQFKVALEQKQNSQNAMERLLPLSWLLGDWEEGVKYAERVIASPQTQINKLTLLGAFKAQIGDYDGAIKVLETISQKSRRGNEIDVTQIYSFVALMQNRPELAQKMAITSCDQYDLVNCWLLWQLSQWENFPLTMLRQDKIVIKNELEVLTKTKINQPLQETVFVNQLDIEEMDDKLIQLIKTP